MKIVTPETSWHGREPILAIDFHPESDLIATGGNETEGMNEVRVSPECFLQASPSAALGADTLVRS